MLLLKTIKEFRVACAQCRQLGLVPTMGYLHEGHLSLVRRARAECNNVAVSIFVNPTQFAPTEDFASYPRDMQRDLELLRAEGVDMVFAPEADEIYPPGFGTFIEVQHVTEMLEGAARPGFFRGVATVVCKLLNITQPDRAYFGQKDAQQAVVVQKLVRDLNMSVEIIVCPTVREQDGLAMSSRNAYLSPDERASAPVLYRALSEAKDAYDTGERDAEMLRRLMRRVLASEPLAQPDYVSAADPHTLQELEQVGDNGVLLSLAVRIGPARLIDNMVLPDPEG
jgi:pantoate--beta-alanine ligase